MTKHVEVTVGELFEAQSGKPRYIRDYVDQNPGSNPVYSASVVKPFGWIASYDYDGHYLTWVMNGYGGRVQEAEGKFSATRDRGVLVPRRDEFNFDLTYMRFAIEPQLIAAAVGRRVDGRLNEYTKIYPQSAEEVVISLPVDSDGKLDFARMAEVGNRLRRIEAAQLAVRLAREPLSRASFSIAIDEPSTIFSLGDKSRFELSIGNRVLRKDHADTGIPVFSANVLSPFGFVSETNLKEFDSPSIIWGIDGVFDWNFVQAGEPFATTDHCGRLQVTDEMLDPEYVYWYLKKTKATYGFDRVFRASLRNVRADVEVVVPLGEDGLPSLARQKEFAAAWRQRHNAQVGSLTALDDVLQARVTVDL